MKKTIIIITTSFILFFAPDVKSQDIPTAMTAGGLTQLVNETIDKLANAATTLMGNGSIVINGASGQVSALLSQFNAMTRDNINKPIQELSGNVQNLANQLYSVSSRLNTILNQQQSCLVLNTQIVIASVHSITSELKNGIPIISKDAPRINYFQFNGHTPSVVPQEGGRIEVVGFNLWTKQSIPPIVSILSEDRTRTILTVTPQRSSDNNSFSLPIDPKFIKQNVGNCLQIKVQPRTRTFFQTKVVGDFYLPLCVPSTYSQPLKLIAHLQYPCESITEQVLDFKPFNFDNTSCEDKKNVNHQECWTLPANGQIIGYVFPPNTPGIRNQTSVSVSFAGNCITAAGWIDAATCVMVKIPPFGPTIAKLLHSSFWNASIAPKISFPAIVNNNSDDSTGYINMESTTTNLCVSLNKTCSGSLDNVFWFEIIQTNGKDTTTLYTSKKTTGLNLSDNYKGLQIDATLNSTPVNGKAQICVKVTRPQCGY